MGPEGTHKGNNFMPTGQADRFGLEKFEFDTID
jgi:hypothetical protein